MAESLRRVRFDSVPICYKYKASEDVSQESYQMILKDSMDRIRGEHAFVKTKGKTQLDKHSQIFDECRKHDITIIFGNLGRHPLLLTYFLDFVFTSKESVGIFSHWDMESPYQMKPPFPSLDFLLIVEPYFGYSVIKMPHVKHLIVLTSHLMLNSPSCNVTKLYLAPPWEPTPSFSNSSTCFQPPVFHDGKVNQLPPKMRIHLDVTEAKSAHEAYLRLLTGREMAWDRIVTTQMSPRDQERIRNMVKKSRDKAVALGWQDDWIYNKYLIFFENTEQSYTILQRPSISSH